MRGVRVWGEFLGLKQAVIEDVELRVDEAGAQWLVVHARPDARRRGRCGVCGRRSPGYDQGSRRRGWRAPNLGLVQAWVEADAPRVSCRDHGVVTAAVPWARHGAGFTREFEDTVAWLAAVSAKTTVTQLLQVAWRTVGAIIARVCGESDAAVDRLAGLRRIGIDEISYKRHHKYLTVVVDHDTGRLVWAAPGRDRATVARFFDALGPARAAALTHVSADGAAWIADVVASRAPQAVMCADPFHVISWATEALDELRRQAWNDARRAAGGSRQRATAGGRTINLATGEAKKLKGARYALWKNPEDLTDNQAAKIAWIAKNDPKLYRGWRLKEGLRWVFQAGGETGKQALDQWISQARRSRIKLFIDLQRKIVKHRPAIHASLDHGITNARVESVNTKIRLLTRTAYGFKNPDALIALAMLALGGYRPTLPGR